MEFRKQHFSEFVHTGESVPFDSAVHGLQTFHGPGQLVVEFTKDRRVATTQRRKRDDAKDRWEFGNLLRRVSSKTGWGGELQHGCRAGDKEAHQDQRKDTRPYGYPWRRFTDKSEYRANKPERRVGDTNLAYRYENHLFLRRKSDERRSGAPVILSPNFPRRRKSDERRSNENTNVVITLRHQAGKPLRRKSDERRRMPGSPTSGPNLRRRKGEERRGEHRAMYHYVTSVDPRIRALERRKNKLPAWCESAQAWVPQ